MRRRYARVLPTLAKISETEACTIWVAKYPDVPMKAQGAWYIVFTYPDSDLINIETYVRRKPVSSIKGPKLTQQIREALQKVKS